MEKNYNPAEVETRLMAWWQEKGIAEFDPQSMRPVYSIDTPPPTVSGKLHIGHVYSYSHADFMARYFRMRGYNVYYPMGFDDNGLPTERLVEKRYGISAAAAGRGPFIQKCLEVSEEAEGEYRALWQRLGLSIDWRYTYRTISAEARKIAQLSFVRLARNGRATRRQAPTIWCPECRTAVAQAELDDLERQTEFITLPFGLDEGQALRIATTRPELLAACVAVFVHPEDERYTHLIGQEARVPFYEQKVPILADAGVEREKGTGAVMCCTFGDQADLGWWHTHRLALIEAIERDGRMSAVTGPLAGLSIPQARKEIKRRLDEAGLILEREPLAQSVRVHERCETAVEYVVSAQWFVRVLDLKDKLLALGEQLHWHPEHMGARYRAWVENLGWDWAISRQRDYGVPFPAWTCKACGEVLLAEEDELPLDPQETRPRRACRCGSREFEADPDVMDTWATSSMSPQIAGKWLEDPELYQKVAPYSLRPQAYEIIRTWAFYTIVKSELHFERLPWSDLLISGWGVAGAGMGKISKSKGGGPKPPLEMIAELSADALRYWAASTSPGKDAIVSEEKMQMGMRLVTKLWNAARFAEHFLAGKGRLPRPEHLSGADRWILAELQELIERVSTAMEQYEYAQAKSEIEAFFWTALTDNYLEMAKQRLYASEGEGAEYEAACFTLQTALRTLIKLLAPFLPYVCEEIYQELFAKAEGGGSIHAAAWPETDPALRDPQAAGWGAALVGIVTSLRRYKTDHKLGLASPLMRVQLGTSDPALAEMLRCAAADLASAARAQRLEVVEQLDPGLILLPGEGPAQVGIQA